LINDEKLDKETNQKTLIFIILPKTEKSIMINQI